MQTTNHILMIRPVNFLFNSETAVNNAFQVMSEENDVQQKALNEFETFVEKLREKNIDVLVVNDTPEPHTPDSIFPNNWISFHRDGSLVLYPMFAPSRRLERKTQVIEKVRLQFRVKRTIDFTGHEAADEFLEGTGSIVLDRIKHIAYACLSPRTDERLFRNFCRKLKYKPVAFHAADENGKAIYHTNVMMCVADRYVVICLNSIRNNEEMTKVKTTIENSGKEIIPITLEQMNHFAGNMLQVNNSQGTKFLVMSTQAYESLTAEQVKKLEDYNKIIHSSLNTIERNGGGSARCMMAEIHLPEKGL
ncbi:MAG: amidinotransferase [Chitinophagaceae bacterium]|nr:amidinotransferase [Chitinophagaceae bacterium]